MSEANTHQSPSSFVLMSRCLVMWVRDIASFLGLGIIGAIFTLASIFLVFCSYPGGIPEVTWLMSVISPMILAHAGFMVLASRITAQRLGCAVKRRSFVAWIGDSLAIAIVMALVLATFLFWIPTVSVMVMMAVFSLTPILPILTLRQVPHDLTFWGKFAGLACLPALPWFVVTEFFGLPSQLADSWGMMDGGIVVIPLTAVHTFLASTSSAVVSTVVFVSLLPAKLTVGVELAN